MTVHLYCVTDATKKRKGHTIIHRTVCAKHEGRREMDSGMLLLMCTEVLPSTNAATIDSKPGPPHISDRIEAFSDSR